MEDYSSGLKFKAFTIHTVKTAFNAITC